MTVLRYTSGLRAAGDATTLGCIAELGSDPIVVTGSANFSHASTNDNDENMLVIRGSQRVADSYFTEFNRRRSAAMS